MGKSITSLPSVLRNLLLAFATFQIASAADDDSTSTIQSTLRVQSTLTVYRNSSSSSTPPKSPSTSTLTVTRSSASASQVTPDCCFLVQDTVSGAWWEEYRTSTIYQKVNLTSLTLYVTPYPNTTLTSTKTSVYTTNATKYTTVPWGHDPMTTYLNSNPGPRYTATKLGPEGNVTQTVVAGQTMQSPQAFYMYSTVKVITAAAVTNAAGQFVCGTPGVFDQGSNITTGSGVATMTIDNVNTNAQAYWGTSKIANVNVPTGTSTRIYTVTYSGSATSYKTQTYAYTEFSTSFAPAPTSGTTLTFDTPFIYAPSWAATGSAAVGNNDCDGEDKGTIHYGYLPSTIKDYMLGVPQITSQYPNLGSCLIAGPAITVRTVCSAAAGEVQLAGGDLTSSTIIMVTPSAEPTSQVVSQPISTGVAAPVSTIASVVPAPTPTPSPSPVQLPETSVEIPVQVPASSSPVQSQVQATSVEAPDPVVSSQVQSQLPATSVQAPAPVVSSQVQNPSPETSIQAPANPQASTAIVAVPVSSSSQGDDAIASAIASLIGAQPVVDSSSPSPTLVVSTNLQTIPYNPASSVQGSTVVGIDGQTNIVVAQPTTIPAPTLVISTNLQTVPYNPASSVEGSTVINSDGQTNIIVSQPTTIQAAAPAPVVSTNFATIPYNPASSVEGSTVIQNGQTNIIVAQPTTISASSPSQVDNPLAASLEAVGSTTLISGTLNAVLPASQTLLLNPSALPTNVQAQTIVSGSQTYVVLATPVTIPVPSASISYSTTLISGTLNAVIPASQTILYNPSVLPTGVSGSTVVSGSKTYIILSTPVTFALPTSSVSASVSKLSLAITIPSSKISAAAVTSSVTFESVTSTAGANSSDISSSSSSTKVEPSTTRSSAGLPTVIGVATPAATTSKSEAKRVEGSVLGLVGFLIAGVVLVGV